MKKSVKKSEIVSAIIKIKCVLKVLNSQSEFELNLAWRLLMTQKRKTLIDIYETELNSLFKHFESSVIKIPLPVCESTFILPIFYNYDKNRLEVTDK